MLNDSIYIKFRKDKVIYRNSKQISVCLGLGGRLKEGAIKGHKEILGVMDMLPSGLW